MSTLFLDSIAWAAGVFEGEGSIRLKKSSDGKEFLYPTLEVQMTDEDVMQRFVEIVEVGVLFGPYTSSNGRRLRKDGTPHLAFWAWQVSCDDARVAVERLAPFFGERRAAKAAEVFSDPTARDLSPEFKTRDRRSKRYA